MELWWIDADGVSERDLADLHDLRQREDGFLWLDVPEWSEEAEGILAAEFGFHPMALAEARERNHTPRVHVYSDHLYLILHAPEIGTAGHVHYLELDQFIATHYLVTVHGPLNPVVPPEVALRETGRVLSRMQSGRFRPESPFHVAYAVVSAVIRHEETLTGDLARQVGLLEQRVMGAADEEPQAFLTALFTARHELTTIRTMAAQSGEICKRAITVATFVPKESRALLKDLLDQYERVAKISQSQLDFLMGVTEFYRARTDTKMTIAAERLAVIAAVTLPVTALSSVLGMNVIVNESTHWVALTILLVIMLTLSLILLRWAKRQGWW
ncbi:magnesium transporter CorA family protein [uncultured Friedmanniella sp.]|uniref:magnesium transporter CorA family protein n=1 Tax=uncultured Friedmanniella sp. TaxID=335381 RepID=UPI0035CA8ADA